MAEVRGRCYSSSFSPEELHKWLMKKVSDGIRNKLLANKIGGQIFLQLTRPDLSDLFEDFLDRKSLWDLIEDLRQQTTSLASRAENKDYSSDDDVFDFKSWVSEQKKICRKIQNTEFESDETNNEDAECFASGPSCYSELSCGSDETVDSFGGSDPVFENTMVLFSDSENNTETDQDCLSETSISTIGTTTSSIQSRNNISNSKPEASPSSGDSKLAIIDLAQQLKFPISNEMEKFNREMKYPDDRTYRKFIRDATACLQAVIGENVSKDELIMASKIICEKLKVLRDPEPGHFPANKKFPYWGTVLVSMRQRLVNIKSYSKKKSSDEGSKHVKYNAIGEAEIETLYAEALRELKSKKKNFGAIKVIQKKTFESRHKFIQEMEAKKGDSVIDVIVSKFNFFKEHDCILINELELHCERKNSTCATMEEFQKNWLEIAENVKKAMLQADEEDEDEENHLRNADTDEVCALLMMNCTAFLDGESMPMMFSFDQDTSNIDKLVRKSKTKQPVLWFSGDDGFHPDQIFLVIDKKIFLEISTPVSNFKALVVLLGAYYAFNLQVDSQHKLLFQFFEEHLLGMFPNKKSVRYRKLCAKLT